MGSGFRERCEERDGLPVKNRREREELVCLEWFLQRSSRHMEDVTLWIDWQMFEGMDDASAWIMNWQFCLVSESRMWLLDKASRVEVTPLLIVTGTGRWKPLHGEGHWKAGPAGDDGYMKECSGDMEDVPEKLVD